MNTPIITEDDVIIEHPQAIFTDELAEEYTIHGAEVPITMVRSLESYIGMISVGFQFSLGRYTLNKFDVTEEGEIPKKTIEAIIRYFVVQQWKYIDVKSTFITGMIKERDGKKQSTSIISRDEKVLPNLI